MKIAYLFGSLNRGGAETLYYDLFHKVPQPNFEYLGICRKRGTLSEFFESCESRMICHPIKHHNYIRYLYGLSKILREEHVDIIHAQQMIDCLYALIVKKRQTKVLLTIHCFDNNASLFRQQLLKLVFKKTDTICYVSETQRNYYLHKYKVLNTYKHIVVYNGIDFSKFEIQESNFAISKRNSTSSKIIKIAMVGNFGPGRDHITLCKWLLLLKMQHIPFHFFFIGGRNSSSPELYDNCVLFCKENNLMDCVHFLGSRGDVPRILKKMDAFVYATECDTFGIAVVEAIASGLPTFVNDWGVMKEITHNGEWATLYQTKNIQDLLQKFQDFIDNQLYYKEKSLLNAELIKREYSIQQFAHRLFTIYSNLI